MDTLRRAPDIFLLCTLFLVGSAFAASGTMIREDDLRASPSATAAVLARVPGGTSVEVLGRQGGWTQVRVGARTGWVRMLSVRGGVSAQRDVGAELAGVVGLGTRPADPGRVVAVAGVRGLTELDLKAAPFNSQELDRLEAYAVNRAEAQSFARQAALAARPLDYLPAPRKDQPNATWGDAQW
jgi:hypothetical protein